MHSFSDYENYPSDSTLLHDEVVDFARWLFARSLNAEEYSEYNVSDFSPVRCAAAWEHINAGRITYWIDYGADPIGIEEYVEFVGFKDNSRRLAEWLKAETAQANGRQPSDDVAPKGKAGRRGYPLEALNYARELRRNDPSKKVHVIRQECLEKFKYDLPPDDESFRRWMNRKRANRAN